MSSFLSRLIGAARLKIATYEDVEADSAAFGQAMSVVVLSSLATGIGASVQVGPRGLLLIVLLALIGWLFWAWISYFIGVWLLPTTETRADWGQLLRTTGFATAPGVVRFLGVVPMLTSTVFLLTSVWMLAAFVLAVRQALDYSSTWRALAVCLVGWTANLVLFFVLSRFLEGELF